MCNRKMNKRGDGVAQLAATLLLLSMTSVYPGVGHAQDAPGASIKFSEPPQFQCGTSVPWALLSEWHGEGGKCGNGLLYTVSGKVPAIEKGYIKGKIVVPEDNDREWSAYNGDTKEVNAGKFKVQFCITSRMVTRRIWIQAYSSEGKKVGSRCTVGVAGIELED